MRPYKVVGSNLNVIRLDDNHKNLDQKKDIHIFPPSKCQNMNSSWIKYHNPMNYWLIDRKICFLLIEYKKDIEIHTEIAHRPIMVWPKTFSA